MIPHRVPPVLRIGPARLTAGLDHCRRLDLPAHRTLHGTPAPRDLTNLIAQVDEVDLRGRGGAAFPFGRKLRAVSAGSRESVVLVNAAEGEPASCKDAMLLVRTPHLVLDGAVLAAESLHAREVVVAVAAGSVPLASVEAAVAERRAASVAGAAESHLPIRVVGLPERFITGEGGALVRGVNGLDASPPGRKRRAATAGVDGLPTLLSNAETFAQLAILAEHGVEGYASVGTSREPGTTLLTVGGTHVVEVPYGTPLAAVLELCSLEAGDGVLMGGYHGSWLPGSAVGPPPAVYEPPPAAPAVLSLVPAPVTGPFPVPVTGPFPVPVTGAFPAPVTDPFPALSQAPTDPFPALPQTPPAPPAPPPGVELSRTGLEAAGATLGAGIIVPLGSDTCPLGETARVAAYLAAQSSGQCGPCRMGLPEVARALVALCEGHGSSDSVRRAVRAVERRGACFHPDGTARFVLSALDAFADDVAAHLESGTCGRPVRGVLPLPESSEEPSYRLDVDWTRCEGHGLCAHLLPEFVDLDEFGYPSFRTVPGWMAKEARRAVEMCPALALRMA
ncbi:NADH-ubiquinone oxidoreductase-F iron-sulfur binding region domain-containing protein [Nonomuraea sp. NPDC050663]|uniref:NADH-ubiquinone oxidoreductase-F iron-sulfur binding region domain-containing protein n=1 Tax=Nonomuraea sp. NPDC050663 TaxID=3364370 RepID=UPI0037B1DC57